MSDTGFLGFIKLAFLGGLLLLGWIIFNKVKKKLDGWGFL